MMVRSNTVHTPLRRPDLIRRSTAAELADPCRLRETRAGQRVAPDGVATVNVLGDRQANTGALPTPELITAFLAV